MTKHTQAHLSRTVNKNQPGDLLEQTKRQMKYYMGAKLIEIGINPKSALYRWSVSTQGNQHVWTISAYWDESKDKLLSGEIPLTGTELINCARANAVGDINTAAKLCGYGEDISGFQEALRQAGHNMGLNIEFLSDLSD
ncbi:hypothetical protein IQ238_09705 [Pleurocapsales cyanobacterium LEGE 06147]|nr:hypothetical protein [Pleurocapsales cyanobacterium LEGE 06147]